MYQNPSEFFERTFLTKNLRELSVQVVRRLSGVKVETSATFNLSTQFGGGKTHSLTLLYHLAKNGDTGKASSAFLHPGRNFGLFAMQDILTEIDKAVRVKTPNYDYYYMCPELRRKRMVPTVTRVRAHSIEEFGELVHHRGEEYIYVLQGPVEIHTEFYEPVVLETGESIYIDSSMGHAYVAPKGHDEALLLGICSSADDDLMDSLMALHDAAPEARPKGIKRLTAKR